MRSLNIFSISLLFFFFWVLMEGALRKWFLPGLASPIFFVKYIIGIILWLIIIIGRFRISKNAYPFAGFYFFYVFYGLVEIFNFSVTRSPLLGIIGCAVHFGFSALFFAIPNALGNQEQLQKVIRSLNYIFIPIFLLGIVQYFSPPGDWINKYVSDDMSVAVAGGNVRITTLFSYIAPYSVLLNYILLFFIFQILLIRKLNIHSLVLMTAFGLGIINAFMTGARSLVFMAAIQFSIILLVYAFKSDFKTFKRIFINIFIFASIGIFVILQSEEGASAYESFSGRTKRVNDIEHRVLDALNPFKFAEQAGIFGFGIGSAYQGAGRFMTERWRMPGFFEEESERLLLEFGMVGFFIIAMFRFSVMMYAIKTFLNTKDQFL
ncbi:MAG: hypothetical protein ACOCXH_11610, partial [Cyclobacteriaceae bacterium]